MWIEGALLLVAVVVALALRPWRSLGQSKPPGAWLACWLALPLLWNADRWSASTLAPTMSGACLLVLLAGWPFAMLGVASAALLTLLWPALAPAAAMHQALWLGVLPGTVALGLGLCIRRWLPRQLFVYILGRGFFASFLALWISGLVHDQWFGTPPRGLQAQDMAVARWLLAWGEATLTGMVVAIFVAFRPDWLATWSDRRYLSPPPA